MTVLAVIYFGHLKNCYAIFTQRLATTSIRSDEYCVTKMLLLLLELASHNGETKGNGKN